jgi:hypothetical protein
MLHVRDFFMESCLRTHLGRSRLVSSPKITGALGNQTNQLPPRFPVSPLRNKSSVDLGFLLKKGVSKAQSTEK